MNINISGTLSSRPLARCVGALTHADLIGWRTMWLATNMEVWICWSSSENISVCNVIYWTVYLVSFIIKSWNFVSGEHYQLHGLLHRVQRTKDLTENFLCSFYFLRLSFIIFWPNACREKVSPEAQSVLCCVQGQNRTTSFWTLKHCDAFNDHKLLVER